MKNRIKEAMDRTERGIRKCKTSKKNWDEECRLMKKQVKRELRRWRGGKEARKSYLDKKRKFKELYERKKEEENKRW